MTHAVLTTSSRSIRFSPPLIASLALIGVTIAIQAIGEQFCDTAWFITFAERVLDGARPYVDIADPNTPAAWLVYMPAIIASRLLGLRPEATTVIETILFALGAICLSGRILRQADLLKDAAAASALSIALIASLVVWGPMVGQREHFATLAILPALATLAARGSGRSVPLTSALAAGCIAAIAAAIKPPYALAIILPAAAGAIRLRSWRPLFAPENVAAAALTIAYGAGVFVFIPAYFSRELPQIIGIYADARYGLGEIAVRPLTLITASAIALITMLAIKRRDPRLEMLAASALGFFVAYIMQGKMPSNHAMPSLTLSLIGLGLAYATIAVSEPLTHKRILRWQIALVSLVTGLLGGVHFSLFNEPVHPKLASTVAALAPENPTIGGINYLTQVSFPLVRKVRGRWVNSENSLWSVDLGNFIIATRTPNAERRDNIAAIIQKQRQQIANELSAARPDVILIDDAETRAVELATPELAHALDFYQHAVDVDGIEVWVRLKPSPSLEAAKS